MTLFVFAICLMAERFLGSLDGYRKFAWFGRFRTWLTARSSPSATWKNRLILLILFAAPMLALQLFYSWILYSLALFGFVFACLTLLYCFGPKGFYEETRAFCDAARGKQDDTARWYANKLLDRDFANTPPSEIATILGEHIFVIANDRIFAVMFWFAVLGPMGALLYRLSSLTQQSLRGIAPESASPFQRESTRVHYWLNWIPSRLLVLGYAATGNFVESMSRCSQGAPSCVERWPDMNERLLVCAGLGQDSTIQPDPIIQIEQGLALLRRTIVLWIGLTVLVTLTRWAS